MADYPNTKFIDGVLDDPFGGQPANRLGVPQHTFQDAQARELQRQAQDQWWVGRDVQYLPIATGGIAGDAVVFDTTALILGGAPAYKRLADITYDADTTPIIGVMVEPCSAGAKARVHRGGGYLAPSISGLSGTAAGKITIDTTSGRLRAATGGDTVRGYCDGNGNCHLLALALP